MVEPEPSASTEDAPRALEAAFRGHYDQVFRYVSRRTTSTQAAEDVTAEVFAIASRRVEDLPRRPLGWLIGVARGVLANHYRSEQRRAALRDRLSAEHRAEGHTQSDAELGPALVALDEDDREVLLLRYWDGLSGAEVAKAMNCSVAAVYV